MGGKVRLLAIGRDKSEHTADHRWQPLARRTRVLMSQFEKLPLDSIEKLQLQSRPMTPLQFKNISLHAGQKTNFEVHIGAEPLPPNAANRAADATPRPRCGKTKQSGRSAFFKLGLPSVGQAAMPACH